MKYCKVCGSAMDDSATFCAACGTMFMNDAPKAEPQAEASQVPPQAPFMAPPVYNYAPDAPVFDTEDIEKTKILAALSYIPFGGLVFALIGLVAEPQSKYLRYHVNAVLALTVFFFALTLLNVVPILGQIAYGIGVIIYIVISIMGICRAKDGNTQPLPIIGKYKILK